MQVETIGDAYMVVGGLPERNTIHADCVANQALDMMDYCRMVNRPDRPDDSETITVRVHPLFMGEGTVFIYSMTPNNPFMRPLEPETTVPNQPLK